MHPDSKNKAAPEVLDGIFNIPLNKYLSTFSSSSNSHSFTLYLIYTLFETRKLVAGVTMITLNQ